MRKALNLSAHSDLVQSVEQTEHFVQSWWKQPVLPWFTDHGPAHSRRVSLYARQLADIPSLDPATRLTALESYILWSAAWLHDLGMQSLLGASLGPLTQERANLIRQQHPDQSAVAIIEHAAELGLAADDALVSVVAYVARAHGTEYYESSCEFLRGLPSVRNEAVRGPLLAAILLMADELDLHYERNVTSRAHPTLNDVSEAHAMKHRHVNSCNVLHGLGGEVGIEIITQPRSGFPESNSVEIERWILDKIRRQIALVEEDFAAGFASQAHLSRSISVRRSGSLVPAAPVNDRALAVIEADNRRSLIIDHKDVFASLREYVGNRDFVFLVGAHDAEFVDMVGRDDLLSAVEAHASADGVAVYSSKCVRESFGSADTADVLRELCASGASSESEQNSATDFESMIADFERSISRSNIGAIVSIEDFDHLPEADQTWFISHLDRMRESYDVTVILGVCQVVPAPGGLPRRTVLVPLVDRREAARDLTGVMDSEMALAVADSLPDYRAMRLLRDRRLVQLSGGLA